VIAIQVPAEAVQATLQNGIPSGEITISVTSKEHGTPVTYEEVAVSTDLGTFEPVQDPDVFVTQKIVKTDGNGQATLTLYNPLLEVGYATITADTEGANATEERMEFVIYGKCNEGPGNETMRGAKTLTPMNSACKGSLDGKERGTSDYYKIPAVTQKQNVTFSLQDIPPKADYDLQIAIWNGTEIEVIKKSRNSGNMDDNITIPLRPLDSGKDYYLMVFLVKDDLDLPNDYTLIAIEN
jgi:hypothetical protein